MPDKIFSAIKRLVLDIDEENVYSWGQRADILALIKYINNSADKAVQQQADFQIGNYTLRQSARDGFMIYHESGEGGQFNPAKFHEVLDKFYKENF